MPAPGHVVGGKYRLEECLGRGGMGVVFRATHLLSEKQVALKRMRRPTNGSQTANRFLREARAAGRIDHPNVVDVYDVGEDGRYGYLVMELLHGESLGDRLDRSRLDLPEAVDLLLPAMRGAAAAHHAGVIHRDLKPDNIFLCKGPDGLGREAKVLDFGISSFTIVDLASPTLTHEDTVLGTPAYMSTEQLRSSRNLDARTDQYSFGVILYEALTGELPFSDDSFTGLVMAIATEVPRPLRTLRPELPEEIEHVLLRALARNREDRYPDMEGLITALAPFGSRRASNGPGAQSSRPPRPELARGTLEFELPPSTPPAPAPSSQTSDPTVAPPSAAARTVLKYASVVAIATAVAATLLLALWLSRGSQPTDAALTSSPATLSVSKQAVTPPAPRPQLTRTPTASPAPTAPTVASAADGVPTAHADTPTVVAPSPDASSRAAQPNRRRASSRTPAQVPAVTPAGVPMPSQPAGRSGTILMDDL
ncbi:MAG TPA: protein kinase [Polyangiales bacterium]